MARFLATIVSEVSKLLVSGGRCILEFYRNTIVRYWTRVYTEVLIRVEIFVTIGKFVRFSYIYSISLESKVTKISIASSIVVRKWAI